MHRNLCLGTTLRADAKKKSRLADLQSRPAIAWRRLMCDLFLSHTILARWRRSAS